ncbi:MAG: fused MFS/spermidine synthase [Patescibacteria group bacterium]|nr:fused MFS/spermidine synthase [Patescibacteria group bacterium]
MSENISRKKLYLVVFLTGAIVMILELIGSRILAPIFGTSIFVWTSLIGIILGAMSLGYYYGGKIADKNPNLKFFSSIILFSGCLVFLILIIKDFVLYSGLFLGIRTGTVVSATILFALPAMFLGAVSPYAVRLSMKAVESSGHTVGNLYAVSTFGSIVGTFLAGFYLIPRFGSATILYGIAIALFFISALVYLEKKFAIRTIFILLFLVIVSFSASAMSNSNFIVDKDSAYNHIRVYDTEDEHGRVIRIMSVENFFDSGMFLDSDELAFEYSKFFRLGGIFNKEIKKAVIFGGAAYSIPKDFLSKNKNATIDVVEIDPMTTEIAKKYFRLKDNYRLNIYHQDARIFLNKTDKNKYDIVYNDAFSSACAVPFHLTTREAIEKIYNILNDDGVYVINLISAITGDYSDFFRAEYKTIKEKFKNVYVFPIEEYSQNFLKTHQNIVIIASKRNININDLMEKAKDKETKKMLKHYWTYKIKIDNIRTLTDDFAPVNYYAVKYCN